MFLQSLLMSLSLHCTGGSGEKTKVAIEKNTFCSRSLRPLPVYLAPISVNYL